MLGQCFKLSFLFGNTRDTSVNHEKAKFFCFNYMQPQKVKFKSVQLNMKQVSYIKSMHSCFFVFNILTLHLSYKSMCTQFLRRLLS